MLKTTFDINDPVKVAYKLPPPLDPIVTLLQATIVSRLIGGHFLVSVYGGAAGSREIAVAPDKLTSCVHVRDYEFEAKLYSGAKKVNWKDIDLDELLFDNDRDEYYRLDEFEDNWDGVDKEDRPAYLWRCKSHVLRLTAAEDQIEAMIDNCRFEDDQGYSLKDFKEVEELRLTIDKFNLANVDKRVWSPDYTCAVLLEDVAD